MGYELNKLMSLYGVSTPGMAPYGGGANDPAAMQRYNQYRTDYMNRVASTPMYGEQQYLTGLAGERVAPTYASPITPPVNITLAGPDNSAIMGPPAPGTTTGTTGTKTGTTTGTATGSNISADPNAYKYNYFDNSQQDNALIKQFQSGENPKTRADLVEFYNTQLGRLPDEAGFNYWLNKFGTELDPNEMKELQAAAQPEIAQRQGLEALYQQYGGREYDIPGLEYWMGEAGRAGGIDPIKERFITGINKEIEMGNAGFRPGMYDVNQMGSRITPTESAQLYAAAPFVFGEDSTAAANNRARQDLYDLYTQNLGRAPDPEGFNYWIRQIGDDNVISAQEANQFLAEAQRKGETVTPMAHGGMHNLAQKYNVGGPVRKFRIGGDEGEPEDAIESIVRARSADMGGEPPKYEIGPDERFQGERRGRFASVTGAETPAQQSRVSQGTEPITTSPAAQPVKLPPSATTPVSPAATDLMAMLANYSDDVYAPELKTARAKVSAENEKFAKMIETAMKGESAAPDKTELYFRLASAFGSPTKTGAFTENLSLVGKEAAEYSKDVRAAQRADKQLRMQLGLEAQKLRAQGAREDLSTLRTLAGEEMKDRRAILVEYLKSGRPQSEAGKAAIDAGLKQGTPEFTQFVEKYIDDKVRTGNMLKEAMVAIAAGQLQLGKQRVDIAKQSEQRQQEAAGKLTPGEVKLKAEAETTLGGIDDAMSSLKRAYSLNPNTFDGTLVALAQRKILEQTDPKDPRVLATREQQNLLSKGAIDKLRASFGGNPTEGERAALLALEGIDSKSKEERAQIMKNTYKLLQARREREQKRLNEISKGAYRETTPTPAAGDLE